ncbi:hypothetical protein GE09DRAFT_1241637 [Coniochaeta sp. 2T2.1]|nr:hypothetical protein GE09DRAFT_1241637 [Coniochaeta sp. 2T2.1]
MQLKKLGSAFILATTAASFIIPDNTTDGVYAVRRLDDGTEEHIRVGDLPSQAEIEAFRARRRGGGGFAIRGAAVHSSPDLASKPAADCGGWRCPDWDGPRCYPEEGTQDLDHRTTDAANAALDRQSGWIEHGMSFYSISECVVAYACNSGGTSWAFSRDDHGVACARITGGCGWYKPGSVHYHNDKDGIGKDYGYESYCTSKGHDFCGHGV